MRNPVDRILRGFSTRRLLAASATALIATIAVACGSTSSSESDGAAPDFSLPVANRNVDITLSDFHSDQNVVLVFYRGFF